MANLSKTFARTRNVALALAITATLAACGGGGGGGGNNQAPPAAVVGNTFAITSTNRLINFDRTSGGMQSAVPITGLTANDILIGFDVRPADGSLVAVANTGRIYTINSGTGAATVLATISPAGALPSGTAFGVDFNPVPDRLRIVSNTGQNLRVNLGGATPGATTIDGNLTLGGMPALGVVGVGYSNKFAAACRTQLFYLDLANNRLLTTTAPNDGILTVVGSLGVTTNATPNGFEFFTAADGSNAASVVLTVAGIPTVFTLNFTTGAVSAGQRIQGLLAGENIVGISAPPQTAAVTQAPGELTGLSSAGAIFTFNSGGPNKVCTGPTNITGLNAGETVAGIDVRPADSNLYGVGVTAAGAGRVFQINRTTGAISAAQNITSGGTAVTLMGTDFGVDFNPVPDRLRLTSNMGQNLRINVVDGTALVDGATGGSIIADAYTNSFGPTAPATTTLYTINSATGMLNIQNPPNDGTQVAVGSLGLPAAITATAGFDINGINNQAIAAFQVGTATTTSLYGINLATGAATVFPGGAIGAGTGATPLVAGTIRGITLTNNPQATIVGLSGNSLVTFPTVAANAGTVNLGVAANLRSTTLVPITGLQTGENVIGLDFRTSAANPALNNLLYIATDQSRAYVVDPTTGAATRPIVLMAAANSTFNGFAGTPVASFGFDFNPAADRLRTVGGNRNIRSVLDGIAGMTAGTTFDDTSLTRAPQTLQPVTIAAAAYSNSTPGAPLPTATTLFTIDGNNDMLFVQNPPNNGAQVVVGRLGVDVTRIGGFDITGPNTALAVFDTAAVMGGPAAVTNGLYSINLANGAATLIGSIQATGTVTGIALPVSAVDPVAATGTTVTAVINGTQLAQFVSTATGVQTVTTIGTISGLIGADTIVDVDFRPSTAPGPAAGQPATPATSGVLYGFGTGGNLYSITLAGVASPITLGAGAALGASGQPFAGVLGTVFGIDFNPVPDRLRVISNVNQNLRIDVSNGGTLLDLNINTITPAINAIGAAYTNAFVQAAPVPPNMAVAPTTVLFDLDGATTTLQRQDPNPNGGVLTQVGRLDNTFSFTTSSGFDLTGGENGLVLAALQRTNGTTPAASSGLYRVNLLTGQATLIGELGPNGTATLFSGLAIRLR